MKITIFLALLVPVCLGASELRCGGKPDLVFVLDSSTSISEDDFIYERNFVKSIIKSLKIGADYTKVGVLSFSDTLRIDVSLNDRQTKKSILKRVNNIRQLLGDTYTGDALREVRTVMLFKANGARRVGPKVVIVITDGQSQYKEQTAREARLLREDGVVLFAIGVGNKVRQEELESIASDADHLFNVETFEALSTIEQDLVPVPCTTPATEPPTTTTTEPPTTTTTTEPPTTTTTTEPTTTTTTEPTTTTTTTEPTTTTTTTEPPTTTTTTTPASSTLPDCSGKPDLVFVLDRSTSVDDKEFEQLREFVLSFVRPITVGSYDTQIAIVSFASDAKVEFYLNAYNTTAEVETAIGRLRNGLGDTHTELALRLIRNSVFTTRRGARRHGAKVVIVVTDGRAQRMEDTRRAANDLKNDNVMLFVVGVGQFERADLQVISDNIITTSGYDKIDSIRDVLSSEACSVTRAWNPPSAAL